MSNLPNHSNAPQARCLPEQRVATIACLFIYETAIPEPGQVFAF